MRVVYLLLTFASCGIAGEPLIPALFNTAYSGDRLEQKIGDCRTWPAQTIESLNRWLESGAWKSGKTAIPKIPSAGSFVFRQTGTNRAWVVTLLAGSDYLIVQDAKAGPSGIPTVEGRTLRCLVHKEHADFLEAEIRRSFPEGAQRIDEELEFRGAPAMKKKKM